MVIRVESLQEETERAGRDSEGAETSVKTGGQETGQAS